MRVKMLMAHLHYILDNIYSFILYYTYEHMHACKNAHGNTCTLHVHIMCVCVCVGVSK